MESRRTGIVLVFTALAAGASPVRAQTQSQHPPASQMGPVDGYLAADRNAEIALARSAAPESISARAEVMVLGRTGYEVAVRGTNEFVCFVERSWDGAPQFWNPKVRSPNCLNGAAARFYLPIALMKARLALAGQSRAQIEVAVRTAFEQGRFAPPGVGTLCYMMSKQQYLNDQGKNWHPHVMFYVPLTMGKSWGAGLPGSPIIASDDTLDRLTTYMMLVPRWSDGTPDANAPH